MEDHSWMYVMLDQNRRLRDDYIAGVYDFVEKAMQLPQCLSEGVLGVLV